MARMGGLFALRVVFYVAFCIAIAGQSLGQLIPGRDLWRTPVVVYFTTFSVLQLAYNACNSTMANIQPTVYFGASPRLRGTAMSLLDPEIWPYFPASSTAGVFEGAVFVEEQHVAWTNHSMVTAITDTEACSSTAEGDGISGSGIVGERMSFEVQAMHTRQREVQTLVAYVEAVDAVTEVQGIFLLGGKGARVQLIFLGQSTLIEIGTDTPATVQRALESLITIGAGNVNVATSFGGPFTPLQSGAELSVTFTGGYGDLPLMTARPGSRAVVFPVQDGFTPFRRPTQAFTCVADSMDGHLVVSLRHRGVQENVTVRAGDDLQALESAVSWTLASVTVTGVNESTVCSGEVVYMTFHDASAESFSLTLTAGDGFRGKATMAMDASLQGVDPLWGTFKLEYGGEVTRPLNVDATAGDVKAALEGLATVGGVSVVRSHIGFAQESDELPLPHSIIDGNDTRNPSTPSLPFWTITFDGACGQTARGEEIGREFTPANIGNIEPLVVHQSGLRWHRSPHQHAASPKMKVHATVNGTRGGAQVDGRDIDSISVSIYLEDDGADGNGSSTIDAAIGMTDKWGLSCSCGTEGSESSVYLVLELDSSRVSINAYSTMSDASYHMEALLALVGLQNTSSAKVTSPSGQATVCGIYGHEVVIGFSSNVPVPILTIADSAGVSRASIRRITKRIDELYYVEDGRYTVEYTAAKAGRYYPVVTIAGGIIPTGPGTEVTVVPTTASAGSSSSVTSVVDTGINPNFDATHRTLVPSSFRSSGFASVDGMGTNIFVYTFCCMSGVSGENDMAFWKPPARCETTTSITYDADASAVSLALVKIPYFSVVPDEADAGRSTRWVADLHRAIIGNTAHFSIQEFYSFGYNGFTDQATSTFFVVAFVSNTEPAGIPLVYSYVGEKGSGNYRDSFNSAYPGRRVLAVLGSTTIQRHTFRFVSTSASTVSGYFTLGKGSRDEAALVLFDAVEPSLPAASETVDVLTYSGGVPSGNDHGLGLESSTFAVIAAPSTTSDDLSVDLTFGRDVRTLADFCALFWAYLPKWVSFVVALWLLRRLGKSAFASLRRKMVPRDRKMSKTETRRLMKRLRKRLDMEAQRRVQLGYMRGITNNKNRCFINAMVQFMVMMPGLRGLVLRYKTETESDDDQRNDTCSNDQRSLLCDLASLFEALLKKGGSNNPVDSGNFERTLRRMKQDFWEPGSQQGAGEVWATITTALNAAYPANQLPDGTTTPSDDLRFLTLEEQITEYCTNCETVSTSSAFLMNRHQSLFRSSDSATEAWKAFLKEERSLLDEDKRVREEGGDPAAVTAKLCALDACYKAAKTEESAAEDDILAVALYESRLTEFEYMLGKAASGGYGHREALDPDTECNTCGARGKRERKTDLITAPNEFVFEIKRYNCDLTKHTRRMEFPLNELNVPVLRNEGSNAPTLDTVPYIATAVVRHVGNDFAHGHYRTLVRKSEAPDSKWVTLDDERVRDVSHEDVVNEEAYMLLFRRLDSF